jgi:hypothetical protein
VAQRAPLPASRLATSIPFPGGRKNGSGKGKLVISNNNSGSYTSVQHWMEVVNSRHALSEHDWEDRLSVLWSFCDSLGKDPDTIIREALDERDSKLDYMRHLRRWASSRSQSQHGTHELQNVIRSFFINNGARVLTKPYPDVYGGTGRS